VEPSRQHVALINVLWHFYVLSSGDTNFLTTQRGISESLHVPETGLICPAFLIQCRPVMLCCDRHRQTDTGRQLAGNVGASVVSTRESVRCRRGRCSRVHGSDWVVWNDWCIRTHRRQWCPRLQGQQRRHRGNRYNAIIRHVK